MAHQTQTPKKATAAKQIAAEKAAAKVSAAKEQEEQEEQGEQGTTALEERHRMIAETAYLIAEQRDFQGDMALNDWLQAEAEVDARFAEKH
jgi:hypothetical protein